jgi:hypothetical protein
VLESGWLKSALWVWSAQTQTAELESEGLNLGEGWGIPEGFEQFTAGAPFPRGRSRGKTHQIPWEDAQIARQQV